MVVAVLIAIVLWLLLGRAVTGAWPSIMDGIDFSDPASVFPAARIAVPGAAIIAASPHLVRPARRFGRWMLVFGSFATLSLQFSQLFGVVAGMLCAAAAAATVHLIWGSSAGRPSLDDVGYALAELDVATSELGVADRQDAGQFAVAATGVDGGELVVKVYGRDAYDAALVVDRSSEPSGFVAPGLRPASVASDRWSTRRSSRCWRAAPSRYPHRCGGHGRLDEGRRLVARASTLRFAARRAEPSRDSGDPDPRSLRRGRCGNEPDPRTVGSRRCPPRERDRPRTDRRGSPDRRRRIRLRASRPHRFPRRDGCTDRGADARRRGAGVRRVDLGLAGRDAAVAGLVANRSNERIEACLPYLQSPALTPDQRRMVRSLDIDLDDLRAEVAAAIGLEAPKLSSTAPVQRRLGHPHHLAPVGGVLPRVGAGRLRLVGVRRIAAGRQLVARRLRSRRRADAADRPGGRHARRRRRFRCRSGRCTRCSFAISYVNLAIPTAAARIAVNVRFFQRQGVPAGAAVATGALDGVSGFIVQAILLFTLLMFSPLTLDLDFGDPTSGAVPLVLIVLGPSSSRRSSSPRFPRLRTFVVGWVARIAHEAFERVARSAFAAPSGHAVRWQPRRRADLRRGARHLQCCVGYSVPFAELLFINMCVSLLSGLIPVPGGIGVTEGGLIFGLTSVGVPQEAAFAAVILYRLATFYLPPIWGFFSLRWLERNSYL